MWILDSAYQDERIDFLTKHDDYYRFLKIRYKKEYFYCYRSDDKVSSQFHNSLKALRLGCYP